MITQRPDLIQGTDEWFAARCGLLTASEIKLILTPKLKVENNEKERAHLYELMAQRITRYVEPHFISYDMLRGQTDEIESRRIYSEQFAPVDSSVGFITNDKWGFTLGYSPDGLVGNDGLIECKSRRQKYQVQTILEHAADGTVPDEFMLQLQTGLLVTERKWVDFISYCAGMPMVVIRVWPLEHIREAIIEAAEAFETRLNEKLSSYGIIGKSTKLSARLTAPTERKIEKEMFI